MPQLARLLAARVHRFMHPAATSCGFRSPTARPPAVVTHPGFIRAVLVAVLALAGLGAGPTPRAAWAGEGLYLTWDDCPLGAGLSNLAFACNTSAGENDLYVAFTMPQAANNVIAVEIVIDIQHSALSLPDWWRFDPSGCRWDMNSATLDAAASFPGKSACVNMWQGAATPAIAQVADYVPGQPGGAANQARIKVTASVLPSEARSLDATTMYYAARVIIRNNKTVDPGACAGCDEAACLVLNSILVGRLAGSSGGDYFLQTAGTAGANWARWQGGGGADCQSVPVRSRAWGQLKGLYR